MKKGEYLQRFDTFYNNISSNKAPGLELSEIEDITNEVFKSLIIDIATNSFEQTEEARRYLSQLVKTRESALSASTELGNYKASIAPVSPDTDKVWYITYEYVKQLVSGTTYNRIHVIPTTQDSYYKTVNNPFKCPGKHRILRLDITGNYVELVSNITLNTTNDKYVARYVSEPTKIDFTSQSYSPTSELCDLPEPLQTKLLDLAVKKALSLWDLVK